MTIEPSNLSEELKKSHRTQPEQLVGLGIFLLLSLGFELVSAMPKNLLGTLYFCSLAVGMWSTWRLHSLRVLQLELTIFLSQFLLQLLWTGASFYLKQPLIGLSILLLLWVNTLLATLLFWKKERISGLFFLFAVLWVFYLAASHMAFCMSSIR